MLADNIRVEEGEGEYKDFPYKYSVYLYDKCVWTDDFHAKHSEQSVLKAFLDELKQAIEERN